MASMIARRSSWTGSPSPPASPFAQGRARLCRSRHHLRRRHRRRRPGRCPPRSFSGFGTENYQARVNSLAYGLDGWVSGPCGLFGGDIKSHITGKTTALGNRDFRLDPDRGLIEPLTGRTQQGRVRTDDGDWFGCNNSQPSALPAAQRRFAAGAGAAAARRSPVPNTPMRAALPSAGRISAVQAFRPRRAEPPPRAVWASIATIGWATIWLAMLSSASRSICSCTAAFWSDRA